MADHIIPAPLLAQLSDLIATRMGWYFPPERWRDLERGIRVAAREFNFPDVSSCIQWLVSSPLTQHQIEVLADHFTVGETYFFRENRSLEIFAEHILLPLIHARQGTDQYLRIWSAACCTGEEPYSLAILLNTLIPNLQEWQITIVGTDINPRFLRKAVDGVYSEWSFRNTPQWIKEQYFRRTGDGRFALLPHIKKMVHFFSLNLAEDSFPSVVNNTHAMDVIFCRNVFIYFSPERARTVIENFYHSLLEGGWLIVSPSETSSLSHSPFEVVAFPGAILHRKKVPPSVQTSAEPVMPLSPAWKEPPSLLTVPSPLLFSAEPEYQRQPDSQLTLYEEAAALYEQGRYEAAGQKLAGPLNDAVQQESSPDIQAVMLLIRTYANQGNFSEAVAWCQKAIAADQLNPRLYYLLATILLEQGREQDATIALKRTLYIDPDFVLAHFTLGNLTRKQKKPHDARRHFHNALMLLRRYRYEDIVPESEGLTAGRLSELILTMIQ